MKKMCKNIIIGIMLCSCLFSMPVQAAEDVTALFEKGCALASENEYEEAADYFSKTIEAAIEQEIPVNEYINCYKNLAICYSNVGSKLKAIEVLQEQVQLLIEHDRTMDLAEIYILIAQYYYDESFYPLTIEYGNKALEVASEDMKPEVYRIIGLAYMAEELYEKAYSWFEIYLDTSDNYLHAIDLMAQCHEGMGDFGKAVELYLEIADVAEYTTTYTEKAVKAYLKDNSLSTEDKDVFVQTYLVGKLGYTAAELESFYFKNRIYDKLFEYYDSVLQENPDDINALFNYGGAKCNNGEYAEAEETFRKVHDMLPNNVTVVLYWGYALEGLGRYEEALEKYSEVLLNEPYNEQAVLGIKDCYLAMGDKHSAAEALNDAIMSNPDASDTLIYYYISLSQNLSAPDFSDAIDYYSRSKSWPTDRTQQAHFVINNIWIPYLEIDKLDAYINYLESQNTEDYLIAAELGCAYRAKGEYDKAYDYFENAKLLNEYGAEQMWEEQVYTLHVAKDYDATMSIATEAAAIYPDNEIFPYYKAFVDMLYNHNCEGAIATGNELLAKNSESTNALELLYITYFEMGDYDNALEYVDKYLEVKKDSYYAMAYKLRILWESGKNDKQLEEKLFNLPSCDTSSNGVYVNALLGRTDKVKEYLTGYLAVYPTEYTNACVAENSAMKDVINDAEIAAILGLNVEVLITEDEEASDNTASESTDATQDAADEDAENENNAIKSDIAKKVAAGGAATILGVAVLIKCVRSKRKIK